MRDERFSGPPPLEIKRQISKGKRQKWEAEGFATFYKKEKCRLPVATVCLLQFAFCLLLL
jgi:hypothetical protein